MKRGQRADGEVEAPEGETIVRTRVSTLVDEIRSSLDFYRAQTPGAEVTRVLVTGGGSKMPGLIELLRERVGTLVEPGRAFGKVQVRLGMDEETRADAEPLLAVAVGLALATDLTHANKPTPPGGRRAPAKAPTRDHGLHRRSSSCSSSRRFYVVQVLTLQGVEDDIEVQRALNSQLEAEIASLQDIAALEEEIDRTRAVLSSLLVDRVLWSGILRDVSLVIPGEVWLNGLSAQLGVTSADETGAPVAGGVFGQISFTGFAFDHRDVALWLSRLEDVRGFINPWLSTSSKTTIGNQDAVTFTQLGRPVRAGDRPPG